MTRILQNDSLNNCSFYSINDTFIYYELPYIYEYDTVQQFCHGIFPLAPFPLLYRSLISKSNFPRIAMFGARPKHDLQVIIININRHFIIIRYQPVVSHVFTSCICIVSISITWTTKLHHESYHTSVSIINLTLSDTYATNTE